MAPLITGVDRGAEATGEQVAQVPETMTAVEIAGPGGPEVLVPREAPVPRPGAGEWLVRIAYAGVNRPDVLQRAGRYPPPPGASPLPGLEISGTVVACGPGAPAEIGGRVCALVNGGGYAEYCAVDWRHCLPVPPVLPLAEAAALPEALFTVWHNLFQRGLARDGETVLVHGGTSGIGTTAIKLARLFGLRVMVTCGSEAKCAAARELGADHVINYREKDFGEEVRALTGGKGAEVILDMVAGDYTQRNLDCLAEDGRLVTIAVLGGARATIDMARLMVRRQTLTGSTLRPRSADFKALLAEDIRENVWPAVAEGELRPAMDRIFPLREAAAAHARMESGEHIGKIVLEVRGEKA
jgi:NADPH2:quinone reductase